MARRPGASNEQMEYLRVQGGQTVRASVLNKSIITVTRLTRDTPNHGFVDQHLPEDAFMMAYQLSDYQGDLWVDGKNVSAPAFHAGNFTFYDYNRSWQANMKSAFDCVNFYIPRAALTALEEDLGTRRIETLNIRPGGDVDDQAVRGLVGALLPSFTRPEQASRLFMDHVGLALCTHLAVTYGEASQPRPPHPGGLSPWQLKRATEIMDAKLDGDVQVADVAHACGLSPSYFSRAFKLSTGMPPYKWILKRRIDKAKHLLRATALTLGEIALDCGFSDQSHFTRVFASSVGASPGQWRKAVRA
ncbi:helix-turn-helix domain-containing protein [Paracoccus sp. KR1-242]|uniref:helix-turn-helix domain-containing protein n=1 Tax=Paracoccus sp. KR1-242 TaxID=3410028 RepID=UPI003C121EDE